jgi:hypothetical protein
MEHASTIASAPSSMILNLPDELSLAIMEHIEEGKHQIKFMSICKTWKNIGREKWRKEITLDGYIVKDFFSSISTFEPASKEMCQESSLSVLTKITADMNSYDQLCSGDLLKNTTTFPLPALTTINLYYNHSSSASGLFEKDYSQWYGCWAKSLPTLIHSNGNQGFVQVLSNATKKTYKRTIHMLGPPGWPITTKCEQVKKTVYGIARKPMTKVIHRLDLSGFPTAVASWFSIDFPSHYPGCEQVPHNPPVTEEEDRLAFFIATSCSELVMDESKTKAHALLEITGLQDDQLPVMKAIFDYLQATMDKRNQRHYHGSIRDASIGIPKIGRKERAKKRVIRMLDEQALMDQDGNL